MADDDCRSFNCSRKAEFTLSTRRQSSRSSAKRITWCKEDWTGDFCEEHAGRVLPLKMGELDNLSQLIVVKFERFKDHGQG